MRLFRQFKLIFVFCFFLLVNLIWINFSYAQIKVYERITENTVKNSGLYYESEKRQKIDLNGKWSLSFDDGKSFSDFIVPLAYDYEDDVIFIKKFQIEQDILKNNAFILVCEGIQYESEIRINDVFITKHTGGTSSVFLQIDDNILKENNIIRIDVNNDLDYKHTIPFTDQINYSKNNGGINKDIYLIAVPKIFVFANYIDYAFENNFTSRLKFRCIVNTGNLDTGRNANREYFLKTTIYDRNINDEIAESSALKFSIENFQSKEFTIELTLRNFLMWSPEQPELYIAKTILSDNDSIIDASYSEFGICNLIFNKEYVTVNGKDITLNSINYYEDSPRFSSALDYSETEKDILKIKELGFNCIRVPGRAAHPYLINICNRTGMFLFQEFPFNEVPEKFLEDEKYINFALEYLKEIVLRDKNAVCIVAWGAGNDFDVTCKAGADYTQKCKEIISAIDNRPVYYTTRNIENDMCSDYADLKGINLNGYYRDKVKKICDYYKSEVPKTSSKIPLFVSSYGIKIDNNNKNGFSDNYSCEAQSKFFVETYPLVSKLFFGNFVSSYSDWNADRPLNFPLGKVPNLKTDGIMDLNREPKQASALLKRIINNQEIQKISEGTKSEDETYIIIISGIIVLILLIFLTRNIKRFRENIIKCIIRPSMFFQFVKEQMLIYVYHNALLSLIISASLSLLTSSIIFFYRDNQFFDAVLANVLNYDISKQIFSEVSNRPLFSIFIFTFIFFVNQLLLTALIYFFSLFARGKIHLKNIYTISVWSSIPLLIALPLGIMLPKLLTVNYAYLDIVFYVMLILFFLCLIRLITGIRIIFDTGIIKTYFWGIIIILIFLSPFFIYFYFYKSTFNLIGLILTYF